MWFAGREVVPGARRRQRDGRAECVVDRSGQRAGPAGAAAMDLPPLEPLLYAFAAATLVLVVGWRPARPAFIGMIRATAAGHGSCATNGGTENAREEVP